MLTLVLHKTPMQIDLQLLINMVDILAKNIHLRWLPCDGSSLTQDPLLQTYQPVEWLKHEDFTREYTKENVNKVLKWNKVEDVRLETDLGYVDWVTVSEDWKRFNDFKNKFPNHQFKSTKFFRFQ